MSDMAALPVKCPACGGDGYTEHDESHGDYDVAVAQACRACDTTGRVWTREQGPPPSDDVLVLFEDGTVEQWGELPGQDRRAWLDGGYPI